MIVDFEAGSSPEADIRAWLLAGRGGSGIGEGTWDGWGITSSTAAATNAAPSGEESRSVGYGVNMEMPLGMASTFLGQTVDDDDDVTLLGTFYGFSI